VAKATGSRNLDNPPFWGGSRIVRPGNIVCSTGFSVISGLTHEMLTAGHCGGISTPWQTGDFYGSGLAMGTETARAPCCDTAIIKVGDNQGDIYDHAWNSTTVEAVIGPLTSVGGTAVCTEGATSGVRCNIKTLETGQVVTFTNEDGSTFTSANESLGVEQSSGQQADAGGDSGGPVIVNSSTARHVYATGTISGGYGAVTCSSADDPSVVKACYAEVWFEEITPILSGWHAQLMTG
jgi:streptogrisin D